MKEHEWDRWEMPEEEKELRRAGLKVTIPRLRILEILERKVQEGRSHLTAEEIYHTLLEQGERIGLATVYRVLTQFEQAGIVRRHRFDANTSAFELDFGEHHDHIVCLRCHRIDEFRDEEIERRQERIASSLGYELQDHALILYGLCPECRKKA